MLQCVAVASFQSLPCQVCCSVLQYVAVCCSVLQCVAVASYQSPPYQVCCSALQRVAVCCILSVTTVPGVWQCVAVSYSALQCVPLCVLQCVAECCSVLQCVAVCCSVPLCWFVSFPAVLTTHSPSYLPHSYVGHDSIICGT